MKFSVKMAALALGCLFIFSACSKKTPKHARLIPKDALFVVGVSTEELGKKVAWSALSGSPLFQEMMAKADNPQAKEAFSGLDKCGIEWVSTVYAYGKRDERFTGGTKMVFIAPLKDKGAMEAYIKRVSPKSVFKKVKDRQEALVADKMYAGWNDDVIVVMNGIGRNVDMPQIDYSDSTLNIDSLQAQMQVAREGIDEGATAPEMEAAFNVAEENRMTENKHFRETIADAHDMMYYINYEQIMNSNNVRDMGMMGMSMSAFTNGSAMAGNMDFNKGLVEGEMRYYASDTLRPILEKFGKENVDKDMLDRLPGQNLNMVAGYHLSLDGMRAMLDKMGMLGLVNMGLMKSGMSYDDLAAAFTGDIVFSMNNMKIATATETFGGPDNPMSYQTTKPSLDALLAIKIGKRANLDKLLKMLESEDMKPVSPNTYNFPLGSGETVTMVIGEKYIVASNRANLVQAYMAGKASSGIAADTRKEIDGHPFGAFVDGQSLFNAWASVDKGSATDSIVYNETRKVFRNAVLKGGDYTNGASVFHFTVDMMDKNESSLLQLLHMAERIQAGTKQAEQVADAQRAEMIP